LSQKIETLRYRTVKTKIFYLICASNSTGLWQTGRTAKQIDTELRQLVRAKH